MDGKKRRITTDAIGFDLRTKRKLEGLMCDAKYCGFVEEISRKELERLIIKRIGYDPRTVRTHIELLIMARYIAPKNQYVFRVLWEEGQTALDDYDIAAPIVELEAKE